MRTSLFLTLFVAVFAGGLRAADGKSVAPHFELPAVGDKPAAPVFAPAQLAYVQSWIRQTVPECPVDASAAVAQNFLEVLQQRDPDKLERLLSPDFPVREYEAMLLRSASVRLASPSLSALREKVALRRVAAVLGREGEASATAGEQVALLRDKSDFQYRRLLDGRMEDDELLLLMRKSDHPEAGTRSAGPTPAKALTAAEIVSEFNRRNQGGSAAGRLQAYVVEGQLTTANGQTEQLMLFKLRPDRFRLVLMVNGLSRYLLGADNDIFWQQAPGQKAQVAAGKDLGERRYMAEFLDPLFAREGYTFELLPDGQAGDAKYFRIKVGRADGSQYVAWVDQGTYRQIGREDQGNAIARYTDFREVAGVTFAFREEITGKDGRKAVLVISKITPNPGLITDFFHPSPESVLGPFQLEQSAARLPAAAGFTTSAK